MTAVIKQIYIAETSGAAPQATSRAQLIAGQGIQGDRYFSRLPSISSDPSTEITLIEQEQVDQFNTQHNRQYNYGDFRRNIITHGMPLNSLLGKIFWLGTVQLKGIMLCEPCAYLAKTLDPLVLPHLLNKGGLRAQILSSGEIKLGETIQRPSHKSSISV